MYAGLSRYFQKWFEESEKCVFNLSKMTKAVQKKSCTLSWEYKICRCKTIFLQLVGRFQKTSNQYSALHRCSLPTLPTNELYMKLLWCGNEKWSSI